MISDVYQAAKYLKEVVDAGFDADLCVREQRDGDHAHVIVIDVPHDGLELEDIRKLTSIASSESLRLHLDSRGSLRLL